MEENDNNINENDNTNASDMYNHIYISDVDVEGSLWLGDMTTGEGCLLSKEEVDNNDKGDLAQKYL